MLDVTGDAYALFDPEGRCIEHNEAMSQRCPVAVGASWTSLATPELEGAYTEIWQEALHRGQSEWSGSAGGRVWRDRLVRVGNDTLQAMLYVASDDSPRHRTEEALRESERRFRSLAEQADFGIALFDDRGLTFTNPALCRMFGWTGPVETASMRDLLAHVHPDDRARIQAEWTPGGASSERMTVRVITPESERVLDLSSRALHLSGQAFVLCSCSDVTGREHLLRAMSQREREQSLVTIAAGLAHDFNNILVSILSATSMLQDELPPDQSLHDLCNMITGGAERIANLTGKLLSYSRGGVLRRERLDLNDAVRDALEMTRSSLEHVNLEVSLEATRTLWADRAQLQQVLVGMLVNAGEATAHHGGHVQVHTEDLDGGSVRLTVSDDGIGMDEATKARMFEPFFSTKFQGRGLSMAAAGGVVRSHGGRIEVQSSPGAGTRITVDLPPHQAQPDGGTVLVVDEDAMVRKVVQRLLGRRGYTVLDAADAREAEEKLAANPAVGCILREAHVDVAQPRIPTIVCSAHPRDRVLAGMEREPFGFLPKPFKTEDLVRMVRRAMNG